MRQFVLGIDIGTTSVKTVLVSSEGGLCMELPNQEPLAVVTGAGAGIGRAMAKKIAARRIE